MSSKPSAPQRLVIDEKGTRSLYEILEDRLVLGRDATADIVLDDRRASRHHAEVRRIGSRLLVRDLDSSNGTFVNDLPIFQSHELTAGDVIGIGDVRIRVGGGQQPAVATRPRAAAAPRAQRTTPRSPSAATTVRTREAVATTPRTPGARPSPAGGRGTASRRPWILTGVGLAVVLAAGYLIVQALQGGGGQAEQQPSPSVAQALKGDPSGSTPESGPGPGHEAAGVSELPDENGSGRLRDLELALLDGRYAAAERLVGRLPAALRESSQQRLELAMQEASSRTRQEAERLRVTAGSRAAGAFLRRRLADFPPLSAAHTSLTELLLEIPGRRPQPSEERPEVAAAGKPGRKPGAGREQPGGALKPTAGTSDPGSAGREEGVPSPTRPEARPTPAMAASKAILADLEAAEAALAERRLDEAQAGLEKVAAAFENRGPHRYLARAERGLRAITSQRSLIQGLVSVLGPLPSKAGRIPHVAGKSGTLISIDEKGIVLAGGTEPLQLPWRVVPLQTYKALIRKAALPANVLVDGAAVLRGLGGHDEADALLGRAFRKEAGQKARIDRLLADARRMARVPEGGFTLTKDGHWLSPQQVRRLELNRRVDEACLALQDRDETTRDAAFELLMGLGEPARSRLHRALRVARADLKGQLHKLKAFSAMAEIARLYSELDRHREHALELIFDTTRYPYPCRPPAASAEAHALYRENQPEVDRRVAAVREAWKTMQAATIPDELRALVARIEATHAMIRKASFGEVPEDAEWAWLANLPAGKELNVRNFAPSAEDRARIDDSIKAMQFNRTQRGTATRGEQNQIRITNEYRVMMGRWGLRLHDKLVRASHGHCEDMSKHGFFSHTSPLPGKTSPHDRVVRTGMKPAGLSENIAIAGGAQGAHNGWVHSPGHHRNLLGRAWRIMGPGNAGRYWCQVFSVAGQADRDK